MGHQLREQDVITVESLEMATGLKAPEALDEEGTAIAPTQSMPGWLWRSAQVVLRNRLLSLA